ncbi:unnamed protein product [Closterium sp. NIES-64]|nr:unnamed protein product [Closterium sp. NIES-64]
MGLLSHGGGSYLHDLCGGSPFSVVVCGPVYRAAAQPLAPCLLAGDLAHTALDGGGWRCVAFLGPPPVDPLPPQGPAPSGVSQLDPPPVVEPVEVTSDSGAAVGGAAGGAASGGAEPCASRFTPRACLTTAGTRVACVAYPPEESCCWSCGSWRRWECAGGLVLEVLVLEVLELPGLVMLLKLEVSALEVLLLEAWAGGSGVLEAQELLVLVALAPSDYPESDLFRAAHPTVTRPASHS